VNVDISDASRLSAIGLKLESTRYVPILNKIIKLTSACAFQNLVLAAWLSTLPCGQSPCHFSHFKVQTNVYEKVSMHTRACLCAPERGVYACVCVVCVCVCVRERE